MNTIKTKKLKVGSHDKFHLDPIKCHWTIRGRQSNIYREKTRASVTLIFMAQKWKCNGINFLVGDVFLLRLFLNACTTKVQGEWVL